MRRLALRGRTGEAEGSSDDLRAGTRLEARGEAAEESADLEEGLLLPSQVGSRCPGLPGEGGARPGAPRRGMHGFSWGVL